MKRTVGLALAAGAALLVVVLYTTALDAPFGNGDEIIYAEIIRGMHRTGDYLTMRFQGEPVLQRPALPLTLYALVARVVPGEGGVRLLPALLAALSALAAGAIVWWRGRSVWAGIAAALFCAGVPTYFIDGRMVFSDPPMMISCAVALAATFASQDDPRWFPFIGLGLGAAVAIKSFGAAPSVAAILPWAVVVARRHPRRSLRLGWTAVAFLALAAPFYIIGFARFGGRFLADHLGYHVLARARGDLGYGWTSPTAYFEHIWRVDEPPVALALAAAVVGAAIVAWWRRDRDLGIAAGVAAGVFVVLSAVGTHLSHYMLIFYLYAAICLGLLLARARVLLPVAMLLAAFLLYRTSGRPAFSVDDEVSPPAIALGRIAGAATAPGEPVYSLDWYAPALGYYGDRPWRLLATQESEMRIVGTVNIFQNAGVVRRAPPWPAGRFVVAGPPARVAAAPRTRLLYAAGGYELWEARGP